jgi:hypothetical protein
MAIARMKFPAELTIMGCKGYPAIPRPVLNRRDFQNAIVPMKRDRGCRSESSCLASPGHVNRSVFQVWQIAQPSSENTHVPITRMLKDTERRIGDPGTGFFWCTSQLVFLLIPSRYYDRWCFLLRDSCDRLKINGLPSFCLNTIAVCTS